MRYTGSLFGRQSKMVEAHHQVNKEKLIEIQAAELRKQFATDCLDVTQLKCVLNVGESNVYEWMKRCPNTRTIGHRKVVPVIWVAYYLVYGGENSGEA